MTFRTRFAPSPTGPLHLGHAYSAMLAYDMARVAGGTFLLRFEDTDFERSRPQWEEQIIEDLTWLGLDWPRPELRQSQHLKRYDDAIANLKTLGVLYPCSCSRADIRAAISAPQEGSALGPVYPGTCRNRPMESMKAGDAVRLDMEKALNITQDVSFLETGETFEGTHKLDDLGLLGRVGDIVIGRKDSGIVAYFMASAVDDAFEEITHVVRGEDLFEFTGVQALLLTLLNQTLPTYHHHKLIRDADGKRLAKRDDARAISKFRADGLSPHDIRKKVRL